MALNYEVVETENCSGQKTFLVDLYCKCQEYYNKNEILPPSKGLIAKLIPNLFNLHSTILYIKNQKYTVYNNLISRQTSVSENNKIFVPAHCVYKILPSYETEIICRREYIVNGKQLTCSVVFGVETTSINVRGERISLTFPIKLTQHNVNGIVFLLENLKFCKGIEVDEENAKDITEKWSTILDETIQIRRRSKSCCNILNFNATIDHCELCSKIGRNVLKRKSTE